MGEITPNTPNPVREDEYYEALAAKLGIDPQFIPKSPVWRNEEEIKAIAEMFSNMSGGGSSGGGVLVVHEDENGALDKTYAEIKSASNDGVVLLHSGEEIFYLSYIGYNGMSKAYTVSFFGNEVVNDFEADAEDEYPVRVNE